MQKKDPYRLDDIDIYSNMLYVMPKLSKLAQLAKDYCMIDRNRAETCCLIGSSKLVIHHRPPAEFGSRVAGNYYSSRGEHQKAITYYKRSLQLNRDYLPAWTLMGHEYVEMKNSHAAIEAYRRAVGTFLFLPRIFVAEFERKADRTVFAGQTSTQETIVRGTASGRLTSCSTWRTMRFSTSTRPLRSGLSPALAAEKLPLIWLPCSQSVRLSHVARPRSGLREQRPVRGLPPLSSPPFFKPSVLQADPCRAPKHGGSDQVPPARSRRRRSRRDH